MNSFETELCAYSVESVISAGREGLTRVELCASPSEDGITPSAAAIAVARAVTRRFDRPVELSVMIRPRGGDFVYSDAEFQLMCHDAAFARDCGADGIVVGLLTANGDVDVARTRELVELAAPAECTFHRAFDAARDPFRALEDIIAAGCRRILTSGQRATAGEGAELIRELVCRAAGRIEIMAGAGVNPDNGLFLAQTGVSALHFSARVGGARNADPEFIKAMAAIARSVREPACGPLAR